jgi:hypothetical protein
MDAGHECPEVQRRTDEGIVIVSLTHTIIWPSLDRALITWARTVDQLIAAQRHERVD